MQLANARTADFRVGPGTPMGEGLRRYWTPVCMSSEIAEPDGDPLRVWLLGQPFVAFRDTAGKVGVLDEACPHRRASLVYGRNEGGGLRCLWHQWKFDTEGRLLETPNFDDCSHRERVRANAYPVREYGGLVWGYFGPAEHVPTFPQFAWGAVPPEHLTIIPIDLDCNFVKPLEGLVDSSHVSLLHVDLIQKMPEDRPSSDRTALANDTMPKFDLELTDFGFHYAAIRGLPDAAPGSAQVRVTAYVAPYLCFIPAGSPAAHMSIPQDDTHTRFYNIFWSPQERQDTAEARGRLEATYGLSDEIIDRNGVRASAPGPGPLGKRNHFVQDRAAMRAGATYSGGFGLTVEDAVMTCSIPGISDYDGEHLVPADHAILRLRRLLDGIAKAVQAGATPVGLGAQTPASAIAAASAVLANQDWRALTPCHVALDRKAS